MSTIRIGFQGCGNMAGAHARRLPELKGVELAALCDVSPDILDGFIGKHLAGQPVPATHTDPAAMYAREHLDAVIIMTPHTLHYEHGVQALDAGCHVFMEKPMVTSTEQAYALRDKVEETGRIFVVGYNTPCTPAFAYIRDAVRNQTFGTLELVSAFLSQNWLKVTRGTWRQQPELSGGGQAFDSGAHLMNSLVWSVEAAPAEVFAFIDNHGSPVDINSVCNIRFSNGVLAAVTIGGNSPGAGTFMTFIFDRGRIEVDSWGGQWIRVYDHEGRQVSDPVPSGTPQSPLDNFIAAVRGEEEPLTSPRNGIHQCELMDAFYASAESGRPASVESRPGSAG